VGIHRARWISDLGFAARQTTYAGEPYHSLSLLDEATADSEAGEAPASYRLEMWKWCFP
jgi:hypothetical protein